VGAAGGATTDVPVLLLGGVMMGELSDDLDTPVLKTTSGVVVLPRGHTLAIRKATSPASRTRIGRAACDQCRYCTEYCPRYLLGYAVEPHRVMRGLGFDLPGGEPGDPWAALCCACGLCTSYACPEGLFPTEACIDAKRASQKAGFRWKGPTPERPHPMRDGRRVPIGALMKRLGLSTFDHPAPWRDQAFDPARVLLRWKQHAGVPARPVVRVGDRVEEGQLVGDVAEGALGAHVHASIAGVVEGIDERGLAIRKG
ncbi:MAG: 4Fe-4S dicluster domain-containing protein, partial [Verrucomicrobiales bacterium]|nr:4Fe-4S dicluster domain-containing protein [Verrucomicrobiales bacterium]